MREEGCEVGPGFGVCGKRLVHVEWDMVDEGADATIIKVHGVDVADCNTANTIDDDIIFVASVGVDGCWYRRCDRGWSWSLVLC